ncbi:unnamed protein product [Rhizoctonia solani]|uniref:Autophagy-related protein 3 n=1 Tax=Rhizoctonia solani TaxID=456999 RepID=A0A8H2WCM1_9AGAM|nr:autophagy-related protein 3 [Rhizoctonia solani]QRW21541.1 autophagy-related protein 3 [Rhizoctonia solani]CAE6364019.1 unnamed protein product [Rhizoctonia solani]
MSATQTLTLEEIELPTLNYGGGEQSRSQTRQGSKEELGLVGLVEPTEVRPVNVTAELPPMDKGFHAYAFLAGGFFVELLIWALPFTYGVFLNHYTTHHLFDGPEEFLLPLVGTLSSGIIYLTSVFVMPLLTRYPQHRQNMMRAGAVLCVAAMIGAAFSTRVWHLLLTQGILYSIGGTIVYFPMQMYVFEWFQERRGLANGLIFSGTGLGGVVLPFVVEKLLIAYGLRTTFIALAIGYALLLSAALPFVKGRLPPSSLIIPQQRSDWSFLRNPEFIVLFAGNFLQGLGNFVPGIWLPTFASDMNLSVTSGTLVVSLMNAAAVPGSIAIGFASDRYDLRIVMLTSMLGSSLSVLILWGLASNLVMLAAFALVYGFLAGGFSALWTKFASTLSQDNPQTIARLMSIFVAGRGVGNVLAAPISTGLLRSALVNGKHAYGLKNYGPSCLGDIGVLCGSKYAQKRPSPVATPAPPHALQSTIIAMNSLHTIQSHFWAVRDYISPVLKESKFKEHGRITPEEFVAAGDFLTYKFPVWSWEKGDASKARDYLPADKQYLVTRKVPCLRRATSLAYTDADEDAEKLLSFAEDSGKGDEWVQTHAGRPAADDASKAGEIHDIPDIDGNTNELTKDMNALSVEQDAPDFDDIPDMEEEGLEAADEATAKPTPAAPIEVAKGNLLQVRTYDVMITYDKYYQTPRIWLLGFDENGTPLTPPQVFQDVSADHAFKTVTIESFPHISSLSAASVHPCKHADVMKKVIERMNAGVVEEQKKRQGTTSSSKGGKRKWLGLRKGSSATPAPEEPKKGSTLGPGGEEGAEEAEGMRVDFYLVVFLKFIASIVPTIEVDSTTAF